MRFFSLFTIAFLFYALAHADSKPLPFFIAGLAQNNSVNQVRTLSSFEIESSLRLHSEIASEQTYAAQMKLQFQKLKRFMPYRAQVLEQKWKTYFQDLSLLLKPVVVPPGIDWGDWITPKNESLVPLAVSYLTFDGRWVPFLNQDYFPHLSEIEKAQVIWQLLWVNELSVTDNLQVRIINNYLFSSEWNQLTNIEAYELFKKLEFNYYESNGFCFEMKQPIDFFTTGTVKQAIASDQCEVEYKGQKVRMVSQLNFSLTQELIGNFQVSPLTPWKFRWGGFNFEVRAVHTYEPNKISAVFSFDNQCANKDGPIHFKTAYTEVDSDCVSSLSFFKTGELSNIYRATAKAQIQGKIFFMEDLNGGPTSLYFHENGRISGGYFPAGTKLKTIHNTYKQYKFGAYYNFDPDGLVISDY